MNLSKIMAVSQNSLPRVELRSGPLSLEVDPIHGGVVRRLTLQTREYDIELLRPARAGSHDPFDSSYFPLVPFCNRIGLGRFSWGGRLIQQASTIAGGHAIHGHGWQRAWHVRERSAASAVLTYTHMPDDWPFAYRAEQQFSLSECGLTICLSVENCGNDTMPAGLGFHPYFRRPPAGGLRSAVTGVWLNGDDMLPTEHCRIEPPDDLLAGWLPSGARSLDHCFTGWSGTAAIAVPGADRTLSMTGSETMRFLVVYDPPDGDFFCAEPVSTANNAVNLGFGTESGLTALAAGDALHASMTLRIDS